MIDVLFAIPELDRGGPDRVIFEIACKLDRARFAPSMMVGSGAGYYLARLPGDVRVEVLGGGRYPAARALRHVRRTRPDIVFATQRMILTLGLVAPLFPRGTRLVLRQANDLSADFAQLVRQSLVKHRVAREVTLATLRRADAVVCQSEAMRRDLGSLLGERTPLHVISNPVDVEGVARSATARAASLPGQPALVTMGRLMPQKGMDILLPALAEVRRRIPGIHLTVFGDGPDRDALVAQAAALGIGEAITFAGFTSEPLPYLRAADLFVLASRWEGFPNAALEALACGTPVVLTDCPGANSEIVVPGVNGRLAAAVDAASVARAIETAAGELASYDRANIQADCEARYSARRIVAEYEHVLAKVAS